MRAKAARQPYLSDAFNLNAELSLRCRDRLDFD